jgi:hypothetical protein
MRRSVQNLDKAMLTAPSKHVRQLYRSETILSFFALCVPKAKPGSSDGEPVQAFARLQQHQGRIAKALTLLQSVYDRFSEGFETADLKTAKAFLNSWQ